jgi:hypothetical protein
MKLTQTTIDILKNFATINKGVLVRKGKVQATVSPQKNIFAQVEIAEEFPQDFGIYDLASFLGVVSLHKDEPELEFASDHVKIVGLEGRSKIRYRFTDASMIVTSDKKPKLPSTDIEFKLSSDDLAWILRAADVLGSPEVAVVGDGSKLTLETIDSKNDAAHTESLAVGDTDATFKMVFKRENMKLLPGAYDVAICAKGIASFSGDRVTYFVATEANSKYAA